MTDETRNVKWGTRFRERFERIENWFSCHPRTIMWLSVFLFLNYMLDLFGHFWPL